MVDLNVGKGEKSDLTNTFSNQADVSVSPTFKVDAKNTDSAGNQDETFYYQTNWSKWYGYYKAIPELKIAIDAKATWTIGKGFKADPTTELLLGKITGWGKDTFNSILENCIITYNVGGDSFCEIIRNDDGELINLKPLEPSSIKIIADRKGRIKRYEQISKVKQPNKVFKPGFIFHLARKRTADEIHGCSVIEAVENIILMRNEAMADFKRVLHRNIDPLFIYHLDTDDPAQIAKFKALQDSARGAGENIYVPKGAVVPELVSVAPNATLNPLPWISNLNGYFYQSVGVPEIIVGGSKSLTEASGKIEYLAFEQTIEEEQLFIEEQVLQQLNLVINLEFPASLQNELISDTPAQTAELQSGQSGNLPVQSPQVQGNGGLTK